MCPRRVSSGSPCYSAGPESLRVCSWLLDQQHLCEARRYQRLHQAGKGLSPGAGNCWEKPSEGGWPSGAFLNLESSSTAPAGAPGPPEQLEGQRSKGAIAETWDLGNGHGKLRPASITLLLGRAPSSPCMTRGSPWRMGTPTRDGGGSQATTFPWAVLEVMGAGQQRMHH